MRSPELSVLGDYRCRQKKPTIQAPRNDKLWELSDAAYATRLGSKLGSTPSRAEDVARGKCRFPAEGVGFEPT